MRNGISASRTESGTTLGSLLCDCSLLYNWSDNAVGAQTERRGGAGSVSFSLKSLAVRSHRPLLFMVRSQQTHFWLPALLSFHTHQFPRLGAENPHGSQVVTSAEDRC